MHYILGSSRNSYGLAEYRHELSADYRSFLQGERIGPLAQPLVYRVSDSARRTLAKCHIVQSTGPHLVSDALRGALERAVPDGLDFFEVESEGGGQVLAGFQAINIPRRAPCFDLDRSEYKLTNFDPAEPTYRFYFQVLSEEKCADFEMAIPTEMPVLIVVGDAVKRECVAAGLRGLVFKTCVDLTPQGRTVLEEL